MPRGCPNLQMTSSMFLAEGFCVRVEFELLHEFGKLSFLDGKYWLSRVAIPHVSRGSTENDMECVISPMQRRQHAYTI